MENRRLIAGVGSHGNGPEPVRLKSSWSRVCENPESSVVLPPHDCGFQYDIDIHAARIGGRTC